MPVRRFLCGVSLQVFLDGEIVGERGVEQVAGGFGCGFGRFFFRGFVGFGCCHSGAHHGVFLCFDEGGGNACLDFVGKLGIVFDCAYGGVASLGEF